MKKILAGIVVILMVGILVFRYLDRVRTEMALQAPAVTSAEGPEGAPMGIPLPDRDYVRLSSGVSYETPLQFGDCVKSVKDVTVDYEDMCDEVNGKMGKKKSFSKEDIKAASTLMSEYYSCKALASRDIKYCEGLSNNGSTVFTPRYVCKEKYNFLSYLGYMAGKTENKTPCLEYLTADRRKGLKLSAGEICAAAPKGLPELCENLFANPLKNSCRGHFPKSESDCDKSNPRCLEMLVLYGAFKSGDPARCPKEYREFCEAFLNKDEAPCSAMKSRLLLTFCDISKRIADLREEENKKREAGALAEINKRPVENKKIHGGQK